MKLLEWFAFGGRPRRGKPDPSELSRRDFFARMAGRGMAGNPKPVQRRPVSAERNVLHVFFVADFPRPEVQHLVPLLHAGVDLELDREQASPAASGGIRIMLGGETIGHVAPEISSVVGRMMDDADPPICRVRSIDPDAAPSQVLQIELLLFEL